jgi:predicted metal-binding protein
MYRPDLQVRTVGTIHGPIDYDVVVCDSCRQTMNREAADRFFIGTVQERNEYRSLGHTRIEFDCDTLAEGWVCSYCRDSDGGPAGYPPSDGQRSTTSS